MKGFGSVLKSPTVLLATAVVLVVAITAAVFRFASRPEAAEAETYAAQVARMLEQGRFPRTADVSLQRRLTDTLAGMGQVPHRVSVAGVATNQDENAGTVTFDHTWTFRPGAGTWTYRTTMPITHQDGRWRGRWSNGVVAPGLRDDERLDARTLAAPRGRITGNHGSVLVKDRPVSRIGISRAAAGSKDRAEESARTLADLVGIDEVRYADRVTAAGNQAFVEAIVYRRPSANLQRVTGRLRAIPGATAVADSLPLAPTPTFADPLLGRVGQASPDVVKGSNDRIRDGDRVGLSGLQSAQDDRLRGTPGVLVEATSGSHRRTLHRFDATAGRDVGTTLDPKMQTAAEDVLKGIRPASAVVAVRPSDGHVLAAANGPGSHGYSTALLGQYAPGSTFKTVTTLALLRAGVTPAATLRCTPTITVDGRSFKNHDGYPSTDLGTLPLRDVFAHSCNTGFISARGHLGPTSLGDAAGALGLTATPDLGVPATLGSVPRTTDAVDLAAAEIGQGRVVSTPLGMATVAAGLGAGRVVRPVLVTDPGRSTPEATGTAPVTTEQARQTRALMRRVVTDGTATSLRDVLGGPVMAKTGTAEYGTDDPPRSHAWMIAIQGDLAVAVFVEDGDGGAATAGPVLKRFLAAVH